MAKNSIRDYDATSGNNTDVQSVDISEGCAASGINNALREIMTDLKNVSTGAVNLETPGADQLNVDNLRLDGNTISSTDTNGDITLDPNGTGDTIIASGNVGIGIASPSHLLDATVSSGGASARFGTTHNSGDNDGTVIISNGGSGDAMLRFDYEGSNTDRARLGTTSSGQELKFFTAGNNERMRIDSSGNVGIGTNNPSGKLHAQTSHTSTDVTAANSNETLVLGNSGAGDGVYNALRFGGNQQDMYIMSFNDSTQADRRLGFFVGSVAGDATTDERLSILGNGNVLVGTNNPDIYGGSGTGANDTGHAFLPGGLYSQASTGTCFAVNRVGSDGEIISFRQAGSAEGSISVSGSTVSYNGGHLSRWSQATDGNRIDGLVKGTVMTNLDQMAVWTKDGVTEDNEQLNCMAVSSVEGDANVAGVFVNWDDDDEDYTADMNIAMTGDMVIRIAQGTTVARGDLLMSAGDGTAKPQDDDIVRSKTIAKVTSTTVSHTYDDGSYLVPCVLMAC